MVALVRFSLLALAAVLFALPLLAAWLPRVDAAVSRLALALFGRYAATPSAARTRRRNVVLSAHMDVMYRPYAAKTLFYTATTALAGALAGIYVLVLGFEILAIPEATTAALLPDQASFLASDLTLPELSIVQLFVLFLLSSATFGVTAAAGTYVYRWLRPSRIADRREIRIDESLPRTVAFMFALSRSGMSHKQLIETLGRNSAYFGEAAAEFIISLRDMEASNADFLTATRRLARTTPSTEFANFVEDLGDVLRTGRPMSEYFREEYEQYMAEKESRQEQILEQLAALAEGYVALLVAGPLFLITILVIIGLLTGGTLGQLQLFVYLVVPLTSAGFIIYLGGAAAGLGLDADVTDFDIDMDLVRGYDDADSEDPGPAAVAADGGTAAAERANIKRFRRYERLRGLRRKLASPVRSVIRAPDTVLYAVVPVATLYVLASVASLFVNDAVTVPAVDDYLIQGALFAMGTFAVVEHASQRRLGRIERALPDLVDRLADRTEAGMTITRSIRGMDPSSVPGLEREIDQLRTDIAWGGNTSDALVRFAERMESVLAVRAVILIINAVHASGDLAPVLRIAADEAQTDRRLARRRRQELFIYVLIIYVSFVVFIGIIAALVTVFIPSLPSGAQFGGASSGGAGGLAFGGVSPEQVDAYSLVLFHSAVIQGAVAGLTAGKLGRGSIRAGAKHAAIMAGAAYGMMLLLA